MQLAGTYRAIGAFQLLPDEDKELPLHPFIPLDLFLLLFLTTLVFNGDTFRLRGEEIGRVTEETGMATNHLRLLSLDGGGVRGLSSLYLLKQLLESIDPQYPPKPCNFFHMIGGTSTGG